MTGLSRSNLHYMRSFADAWPCERGSQEIVQQAVGRLPWGQNIALLTRLEDRDARLWYAGKAVENGWSRKVLEAQIATDLRGRQGSALTSFAARERDLELALLNDVQSFLVEMGRGFALVGRQFPVEDPRHRDGVEAPVAVARYTTGEMTLTDTPQLKRALPDLPELASELSGIVEAANAVYDDRRESTPSWTRSHAA